MNKKIMIGGLIGVLVLVLVGGGVWYLKNNGQEENKKVETKEVIPTVEPEAVKEQTPEASNEATVGQVKQFTVEGSSFKFVPAQLKVKKGDTVKVLFKNVQGMHDFVIDEFEVATNQIGVGEEEEVEFVADKVGTFEYYCSVGNHRAMGMVGKLIVE